jgi:hypothetical protein
MRVLSISGILESGGTFHVRRGLVGDVTEADMAQANLPMDRVLTMTAFDEHDHVLARAVLPASSVCIRPATGFAASPEEHLLVSGLVSIPEGARTFRFNWEGNLVHEMAVPRNAPTVTFTWSPPGELISGHQLVTWDVRHPDGASMTYFLFLGRGGKEWRPVFVGDEPQAELDFDQLPSGLDMQLRVLASDGFHNAAGISPFFSIARQPPSIAVTEPATGTVVASGQPITLRGVAWSADVGLISDDQLRWLSDRDGELGFGRDLRVTLSPGDHIVTFAVVGGVARTMPARVDTQVTVQ